MPTRCENLYGMEQALDNFDFTAFNAGKYHHVHVSLPIFKTEVSFEMNYVLSYVSNVDLCQHAGHLVDG